MNRFSPFRSQEPSGWRVARLSRWYASEPALGSVRAKPASLRPAARSGRKRGCSVRARSTLASVAASMGSEPTPHRQWGAPSAKIPPMPGPGESPPGTRRRTTAAKYRRRRLAALAATAAVALAVGLAVGAGGGGTPLTPRQAVRAQREAHPVHFTVSASGDLLIHSPVWARALALGGGNHYDFAGELRELRPYVAGADLGVCHVETPMTPAPPASYPIFNTPPELADGIKATGWDVCDTASNHSLDRGQTGIDDTGRALDRAHVE